MLRATPELRTPSIIGFWSMADLVLSILLVLGCWTTQVSFRQTNEVEYARTRLHDQICAMGT